MRTTRQPTSALSLVLLLAVAACSGSGASAGPAGETPGGRPSQSLPVLVSPPPSAPPVTGEVPAGIVETARGMLAEVVGAEAAATAPVVLAEAVTWPDGSLGCPEPGMMYTQALVDGYHLVFEVDGKAYDYRASDAGHVRACALRGPRAS